MLVLFANVHSRETVVTAEDVEAGRKGNVFLTGFQLLTRYFSKHAIGVRRPITLVDFRNAAKPSKRPTIKDWNVVGAQQ